MYSFWRMSERGRSIIDSTSICSEQVRCAAHAWCVPLRRPRQKSIVLASAACCALSQLHRVSLHFAWVVDRWLGVTKSIRPVNTEWCGAGVVICLEPWSEVQMTCIWSSWCHCHPAVSWSTKIQIGLTFLVPVYPQDQPERLTWSAVNVFLREWNTIDHDATTVECFLQRATLQAL